VPDEQESDQARDHQVREAIGHHLRTAVHRVRATYDDSRGTTAQRLAPGRVADACAPGGTVAGGL
jgi:hypothetical protein